MCHLEFGSVYVQLALNMRYMLNFMDEQLIKSVFRVNQVLINIIELDQDSIVEIGFDWV